MKQKENLSLLSRNWQNINNQKEEKNIEYISNLIYEKLNSTDPNFSWTKDDYNEFKKAFFYKNKRKITILIPSIIKCLTTSNDEIYKQLKSFSKEVDWYPIKERVKDDITNKYTYKTKTMKVSDCFYIITNLTMYMDQFINHCSNEFIELYNIKDNSNDKVLEIEFLKEFEKKYKFLEKYSILKDVYLNKKEESLKVLLSNIHIIQEKNEIKKEKFTKWGPDEFAKSRPQSLTKYSRIYRKKKDLKEFITE